MKILFKVNKNSETKLTRKISKDRPTIIIYVLECCCCSKDNNNEYFQHDCNIINELFIEEFSLFLGIDQTY